MRSSSALRALAPVMSLLVLTAPVARAADAAPFASVVSDCVNPKLFDLPVVQVDAPRATLHLAIAADEHTRELGLMCVTHLRPQSGMIFIFTRDDKWEFWMKNTLISLDMVWVRPDGKVDAVAAKVPASPRTTGDDAVARRTGHGLYVIELAAGEAARDGISPGIRLRLPEGLTGH